MKKTYVKPSIQVIELGIEASVMMLATSGVSSKGFGTNGSTTTKSENSNNPWDASSWSMAPNSSASSSHLDEEEF